jgi:hypothetical protein
VAASGEETVGVTDQAKAAGVGADSAEIAEARTGPQDLAAVDVDRAAACVEDARVDADGLAQAGKFAASTSVIQASWAWTHDNKEMDLHTEKGSLHAAKWDSLEARSPDKPATKLVPSPKLDELRDEWTYFRKVVRGECQIDPLSSPEINLITVEILDEARRQVRAAKPATPHTP